MCMEKKRSVRTTRAMLIICDSLQDKIPKTVSKI